MKTLYVGDPHIKPGNLKESEALLSYVFYIATEHKIDKLVILGDLWDTHDLVRLSVTKFWHRWFNRFADQKDFTVAVLVGNHDLTGDYSDNYSALHPFLSLENENFKIVHEPYLDGLYGYLPYIHDNEKFIKEANELAQRGASVLISHPNFKGAVYDNGTPINNGVDPDLLDPRFLHLIGGHIHTELEMGRAWYTGNPRWLTKSCANKDKGIWIVTHNDATGAIEDKKFISTESVCTPIVSLIWKEGQEKPEIPANAKVDVELVGSSDWVAKTKKELIGSVSVSSKITDAKRSRERKSGNSLYQFLSEHYQTDKKEKLIEYMKGLQLV